MKANFRLWFESGWRHALVGAEMGKVLLTVWRLVGWLIAVLLCVQVFLIGGYDADGPTYHKSVYRLDLTTRQWRQLPPMLLKRCYIATVLFQVH